ncbi:AI-2E family transporter [Acidocella sp.]|uniref:AI-2E family transporter n=1 Tax=Acidocella sp. TaxID=50710 RepID=UPI00261D6618|nr:AI-2E family transporter [Acidocella sp.]
MRPDRLVLLGLAFALGLGCALILLPFLPAMLWAAILVFCLWPVYVRFRSHLPPVLAAIVITIVVAVLLLVPLIHLALVAAKEARDSRGWVTDVIQNGLPPAPGFLQKIPVIGGMLADFWNNSANDLGGLMNSAQPVLGSVAHTGIKLLLHISHGVVETVVALFFAFLFFLSGEQIIERIRLVLARVINPLMLEELLGLVAATVRGVVFGILGTAAFQGILYAIGFEVAHVPQALILATIAGLISIVPAGAVIIYVPISLYLIAAGHPVVGILLAIYCFVVVGGADSILRPWLISRGAALPYAVTLIGVLGGALAFGALGIFLGPVLLALGITMAEEFAGQPRGTWRQP